MAKKIAVLGAGIVGLYTASKLKEKGFDVFLFEKEEIENVGKKPCSALVSKRIHNFVEVNDDLILNTIKKCLIKFEKKEVLLKFNPEHIVIDKRKLILKMIKEAKFRIVFNIKNIDHETFDYVIGADGASSPLRKSLDLKDPDFKIGLKVEDDVLDFSDTVQTFKTENGFCWIIPKGKYVEYGVFEKKENIKKEWQAFNKKGVRSGFAVIPQGLVLVDSDKYALVGDATGLTKPWSGGGIIWQLYQADMFVSSFPNFKEYNRKVKSFFIPKIIQGKVANKVVNENLSFLIPSSLEYDNDFPNFLKSLFRKNF